MHFDDGSCWSWHTRPTSTGTLLPHLPKALHKRLFCHKSLWFHISVIFFFFKMSLTEVPFCNKMHPLFDSWIEFLKGPFWSFLMSTPVRMLTDIYTPTSVPWQSLSSTVRTAPQSEKGSNIISLETGMPTLHKTHSRGYYIWTNLINLLIFNVIQLLFIFWYWSYFLRNK